MSEHIFNTFLDASIITKANWVKGIKELTKEPLKLAHLADRVISMETNVIGTLENPVINDLGLHFELKNISKFHFGNLQVKTMSYLNRIRIDNYLEILKKDTFEQPRVMMVLNFNDKKEITIVNWIVENCREEGKTMIFEYQTFQCLDTMRNS